MTRKGIHMTRLVFHTVMAVAIAMIVIDVIKTVLPENNPIIVALKGK